MAKKLSYKKQAENAILWINRLPYYKKTTGKLGDGDGKYCCLGVGCRVMGIAPDWENGNEPKLVDLLGLNDADGSLLGLNDAELRELGMYYLDRDITVVNDSIYRGDSGFKNVRKFIIDHIDNLFVPPVAKLVSKHFSSK